MTESYEALHLKVLAIINGSREAGTLHAELTSKDGSLYKSGYVTARSVTKKSVELTISTIKDDIRWEALWSDLSPCEPDDEAGEPQHAPILGNAFRIWDASQEVVVTLSW